MGLLKAFKVERPPPSASAAAMPEVSAAVRVRVAVPDGTPAGDVHVELPSRVTDLVDPATGEDHPQIVVASPDTSFLPITLDLTLPEHTLVWTTPSGQLELPVRLAAQERLPYGAVWRLRVHGAARRVQRRDYCRAPIRVPVSVSVLAESGEPVETLRATSVDLSEGGLLCAVPGEDCPTAEHGVVVTFALDGQTLRIEGAVVRQAEVGEPPNRAWALGIRFDDPDRHGDLIRREVFAGQLRARQNQI